MDPAYSIALNNIANDLVTEGNYTGAIEYYDKALDIDPEYTDAINGKAGALAKLAQ